MEAGDRYAVSNAIREYKLINGSPDFNKLLQIPTHDRLPFLIQREGLERIHKLIGGAVTVAMESINLKQPLTAEQIFDVVDSILDSSGEDFLGIEDVVLFLQKLVRGEAGKLFNSFDVPRFMEMFEKYRQERHNELMRVRDEQNAQFKSMGGSDRRVFLQRDKEIDPKTFFDLYQTMNMPEDDTD